MNKRVVDVRVNDEGSIVQFFPVTKEAFAWFKENVESEPWQWLGPSLCVDHRLAADLMTGLADAGFVLGS
jgi:hypothetical protein